MALFAAGFPGWSFFFFYSPTGRCGRLALSECSSLLIKSLVLRCRVDISCFRPFKRGGTNSSRWCGWRQCMHRPGQRGSDRQECWPGIERVTALAPAILWTLYSFPTTGFQIELLHMGSKIPTASYPPGGCVSSFTPLKRCREKCFSCAPPSCDPLPELFPVITSARAGPPTKISGLKRCNVTFNQLPLNFRKASWILFS